MLSPTGHWTLDTGHWTHPGPEHATPLFMVQRPVTGSGSETRMKGGSSRNVILMQGSICCGTMGIMAEGREELKMPVFSVFWATSRRLSWCGTSPGRRAAARGCCLATRCPWSPARSPCSRSQPEPRLHLKLVDVWHGLLFYPMKWGLKSKELLRVFKSNFQREFDALDWRLELHHLQNIYHLIPANPWWWSVPPEIYNF